MKQKITDIIVGAIKSKTFWFNVFMTLIGIAALNDTVQFIDPQWSAAVQGIGNIIIRIWFTKTAITDK